MNVDRGIATVSLILGLVLGGVVVAAGDAVPAPKVSPPKDSAPATAPAAPQDKMMANLASAAAPGPEHKVLESFAGHWVSHVKSQADPAKPAEESNGTADGRMVLGGRFVHVTHKGTMMGQPFEGMMLTGYDTMAKKYVSIWADTMSTAIVHYDGSYDKNAKRLMMGARFTNPATRTPMRTRSVTTFVNPSRFTYEEFSVDPDGKERLLMTITFDKKG